MTDEKREVINNLFWVFHALRIITYGERWELWTHEGVYDQHELWP